MPCSQLPYPSLHCRLALWTKSRSKDIVPPSLLVIITASRKVLVRLLGSIHFRKESSDSMVVLMTGFLPQQWLKATYLPTRPAPWTGLRTCESLLSPTSSTLVGNDISPLTIFHMRHIDYDCRYMCAATPKVFHIAQLTEELSQQQY